MAHSTPSDTAAIAWMFGVLLFVCVLVTGLQPIRSPDYWHHLAAGRYVVEHGPARQDPFSHTALGKRWIQFEWLSQWLMYVGYRRVGPEGSILIKALLIAEGYVLIWLAARRRAGAAAASVVVLAVAAAGVPRSFVRPEMFSWLIFGAFVLTLYATRRGRLRLVLLLPPLMALWVNLHGAWAGGLALVGAVAAGESIKALVPKLSPDDPDTLNRRAACLWTVFAGCAAATLINPYGLAIWHVPLKLMRSQAVARHILEWRASDPSVLVEPRFVPIWIGCLIVLATLRRIDVTDLLVLAAFGFLAVRARRQIVLFGFVCAPIFAQHLEVALRRLPASVRRVRPSVARAGVGAVMGCTLWLAMGPPVFDKLGVRVMTEGNVPARAVAFLQRHRLVGNLFNTYRFGNYLIWSRHPQNPVFIDGRVDMYGDAILREYGRLLEGPADWQAEFKAMNIRLVMIETPTAGRKAAPLIDRLMASPTYKLVHWDDVAYVFLRTQTAQAPTVGRMLLRALPGGRLIDPLARTLAGRLGGGLPAAIREYTIRPDTFSPATSTRAQTVQAVSEFRRVLEKNPDCLLAHSRIAQAYEALGRPRPAVEHLRAVAEARPDSAAARYNLGRALVMLGAFEEGEPHLRAALDLGGYAVQARRNLGNAAFLQGRYADAAEHFRRLVDRAPDDWRARLMLADAYEKMGRIDDARRQVDAVLQRHPDNPAARGRMNRLREQR